MINLKILKIAENSLNIGLKNKYTQKSKIKNKICGDKISIELILRKILLCLCDMKQNLVFFVRHQQVSCQMKLKRQK